MFIKKIVLLSLLLSGSSSLQSFDFLTNKWFGPGLTTFGIIGLIGMREHKLGNNGFHHFPSKVQYLSEKIFLGIALTGIVTTIWQYNEENEEREIPQPYDFR